MDFFTGSDELLARTQYKYLNQSEGYVSQLISSLVSENWSSIIDNCDISSWKEALAAALTHTSVDEQLLLCGLYSYYINNKANFTLSGRAF